MGTLHMKSCSRGQGWAWSRLLPASVRLLVAALCLGAAAVPSEAQDAVFTDNFTNYKAKTLTTGCGSMTSGAWQWSSQYWRACYSAGWGVVCPSESDQELALWGGVVPYGGGDCSVSASLKEYERLEDYTFRATVTPVAINCETDGGLTGVAGLAGRVQNGCGSCSGYLLLLVLGAEADDDDSGGADRDGGVKSGKSSVQLLCNNRGSGCNGSEEVTLLAEDELNIHAKKSGVFQPEEEYVLEIRFRGTSVEGAVWKAKTFKEGEGNPLGEVRAEEQTEFGAGTFGFYVGSCSARFDDAVVVTEESTTGSPSDVLDAEVSFNRGTLSLRGEAGFLPCYLELPRGNRAADIDVASVLLDGAVPAELGETSVGDYDFDGVDDRLIKFRRDAVFSAVEKAGSASESAPTMSRGLQPGDLVEVSISGSLLDGVLFSGTDVVKIYKGKKKKSSLHIPRTPVSTRPSIGFELSMDAPATLCVFDVTGRRVKTLLRDHVGVGSYNVTWDLQNDAGVPVPSGIYLIALEQSGESVVEKMLVTK
jgi:hypothetical protein